MIFLEYWTLLPIEFHLKVVKLLLNIYVGSIAFWYFLYSIILLYKNIQISNNTYIKN
jgi:hypothetical protein